MICKSCGRPYRKQNSRGMCFPCRNGHYRCEHGDCEHKTQPDERYCYLHGGVNHHSIQVVLNQDQMQEFDLIMKEHPEQVEAYLLGIKKSNKTILSSEQTHSEPNSSADSGKTA